MFPTVFGWLGAAVGMLAASTMVPSCSVSAEQAERLQLNLPWVGTVVFALVGVVLFRWLSARKRFLLIAAAGASTGTMLFSVASSLLYKGRLAETHLALARFAFLYLGLLGAVLFVAFEARRPHAGPTRTHRVIGAAAASIGPMEILYWGVEHVEHGSVIAPIAAATWCLSVLACVVLAALVVREGLAMAAIEAAPRESTPTYRANPPGVEDARLVVHRRARGFVGWLLAVSVASSVGALFLWRQLATKDP